MRIEFYIPNRLVFMTFIPHCHLTSHTWWLRIQIGLILINLRIFWDLPYHKAAIYSSTENQALPPLAIVTVHLTRSAHWHNWTCVTSKGHYRFKISLVLTLNNILDIPNFQSTVFRRRDKLILVGKMNSSNTIHMRLQTKPWFKLILLLGFHTESALLRSRVNLLLRYNFRSCLILYRLVDLTNSYSTCTANMLLCNKLQFIR